MATFPTIYHAHAGGNTMVMTPRVAPYEDRAAVDPTVRNPLEAGYVLSRARFTRTPHRYTIRFEGMSTVQKDVILTFENARNIGGESFTWTNPEGDSKTVRFLNPVTYTPWNETNFTRWVVNFILEEV